MDRQIAEPSENLKGWGVDANPENNPTYPIKHYTGDDHQRIHYAKPPQQRRDVEILHSNERPTVTAVFGTSTPPSGLSGMLRRYAFKHSENSSKHWMTLILADRINAIEGIIDDLRRGHIPNIFAERGWNAEWKYNRKGLIKKVAGTVIVASAIITLLMLRRSKRDR